MPYDTTILRQWNMLHIISNTGMCKSKMLFNWCIVLQSWMRICLACYCTYFLRTMYYSHSRPLSSNIDYSCIVIGESQSFHPLWKHHCDLLKLIDAFYMYLYGCQWMLPLTWAVHNILFTEWNQFIVSQGMGSLQCPHSTESITAATITLHNEYCTTEAWAQHTYHMLNVYTQWSVQHRSYRNLS